MKKNFTLFLLIFIFNISNSQNVKDIKNITSGYNLEKINSLKKELMTKSLNDKQKAEQLAKSKGWPLTVTKPDGTFAEIMKVGLDGNPVYYSTENASAAVATRANLLHSGGALGLNLNGQNMVARIWDGGRVRPSHSLFGDRVNTIDDQTTVAYSQHATHVTGTVVASAAAAATKGMAFEAQARTFNWSSDEAEVLSEVTDGMLISNHSYGVPLISPTSSIKQLPWLVGAYIQDAQVWDEIGFLAPMYLMVTAAGNSGFDSNDDPSTPSYDKLIGNKLSKNVLTVANCTDVVADATGNITSGIVINGSSSQGPADDGRIKPDITGNGTGLLSASSESDSATATMSGTSMASPNVAGTLLLVQQHYNNTNNNFMRAATLKGLATHTADDAGNIGPDAIFGWGLLNARKCVEAINQNGHQSWISEETLRQGQTYTTTVRSLGTGPLIASITWTDPAGAPNNNTTINNNPMKALVNDLDIRVTNAAGTFFPWKLISDASANATRVSDNNVDNVENIKIDAPEAGLYTITITHKGQLVNNYQRFSLVVTGINSGFAITEQITGDVVVCSNRSANFGFNHRQIGVGTTKFSAVGLPAGATAIFSNNSLSGDGTVNMTISNLTNVTPGIYTIGIVGNNDIDTETRYKTVQIYSSDFQPLIITAPNNNINDAAIVTTIKWNKNINAETYKVEISTNSDFTNIVTTAANIVDNSYITSGLGQSTTYFYRVIPSNRCSSASVESQPVRTFTTGRLQCGNVFTATDFSNSTINSTPDALAIIPITVSGGLKVADLNVTLTITHTYVQDMTISLIGPESIGSPEILLTKETCGQFNDIDATFDDSGMAVACGNTPPSISGTITAVGKLSSVNGLMADGVWKIKVVDPYDNDGGSVTQAVITICKVVATTLSNENFDSIIFNVYPNPTKGLINIDLSKGSDSKSKMLITDALGRIVMSQDLAQGNNSIDLSSYQKGVYIINVQSDGLTQTKKIILQ
ncbi:MAG: hypothetical protein RLZZ312_1579 [Bacteroidota bacterium]